MLTGRTPPTVKACIVLGARTTQHVGLRVGGHAKITSRHGRVAESASQVASATQDGSGTGITVFCPANAHQRLDLQHRVVPPGAPQESPLGAGAPIQGTLVVNPGPGHKPLYILSCFSPPMNDRLGPSMEGLLFCHALSGKKKAALDVHSCWKNSSTGGKNLDTRPISKLT